MQLRMVQVGIVLLAVVTTATVSSTSQSRRASAVKKSLTSSSSSNQVFLGRGGGGAAPPPLRKRSLSLLDDPTITSLSKNRQIFLSRDSIRSLTGGGVGGKSISTTNLMAGVPLPNINSSPTEKSFLQDSLFEINHTTHNGKGQSDSSIQILGALANLPHPESSDNIGKNSGAKFIKTIKEIEQNVNEKKKLPTSRSRSFFPSRDQSFTSVNHSPSNNNNFIHDDSNFASKFPSNFEGRHEGALDIGFQKGRDSNSVVGHSIFVDSEREFQNQFTGSGNNFKGEGPIIIHRSDDNLSRPVLIELRDINQNTLTNSNTLENKFGPVITTIHGGPGSPDIVIPHSVDRDNLISDPSHHERESLSKSINTGSRTLHSQNFPNDFPINLQSGVIHQFSNFNRRPIIQIAPGNTDFSEQFSTQFGQHQSSSFTRSQPKQHHGGSFFPRTGVALEEKPPTLRVKNNKKHHFNDRIRSGGNKLANGRINDRKTDFLPLFGQGTRQTNTPFSLEPNQNVDRSFRWRPTSTFLNLQNNRDTFRMSKKRRPLTHTVSG